MSIVKVCSELFIVKFPLNEVIISMMKLQMDDLRGIYKEIATVSDIDTARKVHRMFGGQQVSFPKKLYTTEFLCTYVKNNYNGRNTREIADMLGISDRRIRQILSLK